MLNQTKRMRTAVLSIRCPTAFTNCEEKVLVGLKHHGVETECSQRSRRYALDGR